ncbi:hypothetical protein ACLI4Z_16465 [Natrialbaceae archaeon A-arb3/5]
MRRRAYLGGIAVSVVAFSGCSGLLGPDPQVTDTEAGQSFSGAISGTGEIGVALVNEGQSGEVEIEVVLEDDGGTVLGRETQQITMDEDEQRQETISVDIPDGTERYRVEAEAA